VAFGLVLSRTHCTGWSQSYTCQPSHNPSFNF